MRPDWLTLQRWGAVIAVALFILSTTPHDHDDGEECVNGTCVPCHVQGLPIIDSIDRSGLHDNTDTPIHLISAASTQPHPRDAVLHGHDSRAPPA